jgi:hypothetical protein
MSSSPTRRDRAFMRSIGRCGGLAKSASDHDPTMIVARAAFQSSFERKIRERFPDLDDEAEIARRATALRKLHYQRMSIRSAQVRAAKGRRARRASGGGASEGAAGSA